MHEPYLTIGCNRFTESLEIVCGGKSVTVPRRVRVDTSAGTRPSEKYEKVPLGAFI